MTTDRTSPVTAPAPLPARLVLAPARADRAFLDGGWWPRSWDPMAELPSLVLALSDRYGPIRKLMLNSVTWDGRFRRLVTGTVVVRTGWFTSLDPALLIATTATGDQIDILVVPPQTGPEAANLALTAAADPANTKRAPDLLAAPTPPGPDDGSGEDAVWDNEGGQHRAAADQARAGPLPDGVTVAAGTPAARPLM